MERQKPFERRLKSGEAMTFGDTIIMPQCEAYIIRLPWGQALLNRPAAVFVDQGGTVERRRIIDVTRRVQLGLLGLSLVFLLIGWAANTHNEGD